MMVVVLNKMQIQVISGFSIIFRHFGRTSCLQKESWTEQSLLGCSAVFVLKKQLQFTLEVCTYWGAQVFTNKAVLFIPSGMMEYCWSCSIFFFAHQIWALFLSHNPLLRQEFCIMLYFPFIRWWMMNLDTM